MHARRSWPSSATARADDGHEHPTAGVAAAYLGPALVVGLVTLSWFQPGRFIAAGDVSPFVRNSLASEAGSLWNHQLTGAGNTSADAGRLLEVALIGATRSMAGSELLAQRILFVAVMSFAVLGVVHAGRLLVRHPHALAMGGVLGVCNPFVLVQLPNLIFPLAIGSLGALVGELLGFLGGRPTTVVRLTLASLPLAYLSINPPLLVMIVGVAAAALVASTVGSDGAGATWWTIARALPVVVGVHLFWLVPFVVVNVGGAEGVTFAAVTDVDAWSWIHAESSLGRVATLTAHWGWPFDEYFPWSERLDSMPWIALRWVLPLGALMGACLADQARRPMAWVLVSVAVLMIALSQGLHTPLGPINRVLYDHVPGWWLFRDPVSKFGPVIVLIYAVLFALAIERSATRLAGAAGVRRVLGATAVTVATTAAIMHPYPLLTGDVAATDRGALPSSHVAVPPAWLDLAAEVAASPAAGKVAMFPLNDYYQVTTTWGYHGTDVIPQLFDRPVLQRLPGGYFAEIEGYEALIEAGESAILAGNSAAANRLLDALGASHLVIRRDVGSGLSGRAATDVERLLEGASQIDELQLVEVNDVGALFERRSGALLRAESLAIAAAVGTEVDALLSGPGAVVPPTTAADRIIWNHGAAPELTFVSEADRYAVGLGSTDQLEVVMTNDRVTLRADLVDELAIDGRPLSTEAAFTMRTDGLSADALLVDGEVVPYEEGMVLALEPDEPVIALSRAPSQGLGQPGPLNDCNNFDDRTMNELGFDAVVSGSGVVLSANDHSACVVYNLGPGHTPAELSVSMASLSGRPARLCVWSVVDHRCVIEDRVAERSWVARTYVLDAEARVGGLALYVYADGGGNESTVAGYRDIAVHQLRPIGAGSIERGTSLASVDLVGGRHELTISPRAASVLGPFGQLGDCNRSDDRTPTEAGLGATVDGSTVSLEARAHAACVDAPIDADPGEPVVVSFDYRVAAGSEPRFCLWQSGTESCAPAAPLDGSGRYEAEVRTSADAIALSLYLYADGNDGGLTRIEYRRVAVTRARATQVVLDRTGDRRHPAPSVGFDQLSTSSYRVDISNANGPFVLVLAESFAPGWTIPDLPDGWTAAHVKVDGYANGWRLDGHGDATLTLTYREAGLASAANKASLVAAASLLAVPGWRRWRRGDLFNHPGGPGTAHEAVRGPR
ncbi:MAG: hypothetical protein OEV40_13645 [Acidimicrobiia bacterium]|nr:hypothetical protein [Acidimicrobiia bacterium]